MLGALRLAAPADSALRPEKLLVEGAVPKRLGLAPAVSALAGAAESVGLAEALAWLEASGPVAGLGAGAGGRLKSEEGGLAPAPTVEKEVAEGPLPPKLKPPVLEVAGGAVVVEGAGAAVVAGAGAGAAAVLKVLMGGAGAGAGAGGGAARVSGAVMEARGAGAGAAARLGSVGACGAAAEDMRALRSRASCLAASRFCSSTALSLASSLLTTSAGGGPRSPLSIWLARYLSLFTRSAQMLAWPNPRMEGSANSLSSSIMRKGTPPWPSPASHHCSLFRRYSSSSSFRMPSSLRSSTCSAATSLSSVLRCGVSLFTLLLRPASPVACPAAPRLNSLAMRSRRDCIRPEDAPPARPRCCCRCFSLSMTSILESRRSSSSRSSVKVSHDVAVPAGKSTLLRAAACPAASSSSSLTSARMER